MTVGEEYEKAVIDDMRQRAQGAVDRAARDRVRQVLENWFSFTARKKPLSDLAQRMEDFRKRIGVLADNFELDIGLKGYVVRVSGEAEATWRMLEHGTGWFSPAQEPTAMVVGAIFE